jgi:hypothetical protein
MITVGMDLRNPKSKSSCLKDGAVVGPRASSILRI